MSTPDPTLLALLDEISLSIASSKPPPTDPPKYTMFPLHSSSIPSTASIESIDPSSLLGAWDGAVSVQHEGGPAERFLLHKLDAQDAKDMKAGDIGNVGEGQQGLISLGWHTRKVVKEEKGKGKKEFEMMSVRFAISPGKAPFTSATLEIRILPSPSPTSKPSMIKKLLSSRDSPPPPTPAPVPTHKVLAVYGYHTKAAATHITHSSTTLKDITGGISDKGLTHLSAAAHYGTVNAESYETVEEESMIPHPYENGTAVRTSVKTKAKDGRGLVGAYETWMVLEGEGEEVRLGVWFEGKTKGALWTRFQVGNTKAPVEVVVPYKAYVNGNGGGGGSGGSGGGGGSSGSGGLSGGGESDVAGVSGAEGKDDMENAGQEANQGIDQGKGDLATATSIDVSEGKEV